MILNFKRKFPNGQFTYFQGAITNERKIHSIRKGSRWQPGKTIHFSTGARTKQYKCFKEGTCISVQKIEISWDNAFDGLKIKVDDRFLENHEIMKLSMNDGFDHMKPFEDWFKPILPFTGQIIHWTDFKY